MSENRFTDEFTVHVISSDSMAILDSNTLSSFRNFFNDEIQLAGDWRLALSEIIFPTKIEHIVNGDMVVYSLKGYEDSQKRATEANVISRPYNGEKLSIMTGTYNSVVDILTTIKRNLGLPNFSFIQIKKTGKFEILMGKNEGITFPSKEIPSTIGFSGIPDGSGVHIGYKMKSATSNNQMKSDETAAYYGEFPVDLCSGKHITFIFTKIIEYQYVGDTSAIKAAEIARRKNLVRESAECTFYGKVAVDFFTCDKNLFSGVTLRIEFRRSIDNFVIVSDDAATHYKVKIVEANLYVRKMTLNEEIVSAIEKTLLTSPAAYPYFEILTKTFLASTGPHSWKQENIFAREPIRRLAICLNTNEAFLGNNMQNSFPFQKFDLEQIYIYCNRLPATNSPISTADNKLLYFNTISDLAYIDNGHGISLSDYPNHFIMVFDLTSTQQASHDFIHPELTDCSISIELKYSAALPTNIEIFIFGEKTSTIFFDTARRVSKNHILTNVFTY